MVLFFFIYSRVVDVVMTGITVKSEQTMDNGQCADAMDCAGGEQRDAIMEPIRFIPAENEESKRSKENQGITDLAA